MSEENALVYLNNARQQIELAKDIHGKEIFI